MYHAQILFLPKFWRVARFDTTQFILYSEKGIAYYSLNILFFGAPAEAKYAGDHVPSLIGGFCVLVKSQVRWLEGCWHNEVITLGFIHGESMFLTLLIVTLAVSFAVSAIVAMAFATPIDGILKRIIDDAISSAWLKYLKFAILVVGVSAGVEIYALEKYITPQKCNSESMIVELTNERWILELYRTVIDTLQGIAWLLLVFFVFALIAYVIVRIAEMRQGKNSG